MIRSIEPILSAQGLELSSVVRADGNMMSMVFSRNVPHLRDAQLQERFDQWLKSATNLVDNSTEAGNRPAPSPAAEYSSGGAKTTKVGYLNRNQQRCMGHRGVPGTDHGQLAYGMECLKCGHIYGANGTDIFQRKCPECGGAKPGIPF